MPRRPTVAGAVAPLLVLLTAGGGADDAEPEPLRPIAEPLPQELCAALLAGAVAGLSPATEKPNP